MLTFGAVCPDRTLTPTTFYLVFIRRINSGNFQKHFCNWGEKDLSNVYHNYGNKYFISIF